MKPSTLILASSVAINAALVIFLAVGRPSSSDSSPSSATSPSARASSSAAGKSAGSTATWAALQSDELSTQRDRLSAEGFPPSAIRAILAAQIHEGYAARRKAIEAAQGELPFWKNASADPKIQAELVALSKLQQQALKDLLGPDPEYGSAAGLRRQLPGLFPEKIDELAAIRDRYNDQRQDIYANAVGGPTSAEDRQKIVELDKIQRAEIAALLTPQEMEDYELRTSSAASLLRNTLTAFDATESEFRALYRLQSAFNEQYPTTLLGSLPPDEQSAMMRRRSEGQKQMTDEIKGVLGPDRFAEYQRGTDSYFRQTSQLVSRLELPVEAAHHVYAVQKDIQQRVQSLQTDRTLTAESRNAQLAAFAAEAEQRISATLGATGYEAYKTNGGNWMNQLQPRPGPPPR